MQIDESHRAVVTPAEVCPALLDSFGLDITETELPSGLSAPGVERESRAPMLAGDWSGNIIRVVF